MKLKSRRWVTATVAGLVSLQLVVLPVQAEGTASTQASGADGAVVQVNLSGDGQPHSQLVSKDQLKNLSLKNIQQVSSTPVTKGVQLETWSWQTKKGAVKAYTLVIDRSQPVELRTITADKGNIGKRASVEQMANDYGAVAAVNADFFNTKAEVPSSLGAVVDKGVLLSSPAYLVGMNSFGITKEGEAVIAPLLFEGNVQAADGESFPLSGLNKAIYYPDMPDQGPHSHSNRLQLYDEHWGSANRGLGDGLTTPTEVLIRDGIVTEISMDKPFDGVVPKGALILTGNGKAADFLKTHVSVGDPITITYGITPDKDWEMAVGGQTLLVDQGKKANYTRDVSSIGGYRSRTALGMSKDGRYITLLAIERSDASAGASLSETVEFLMALGIWNAVNFDGGGSTTLVARPLGQTLVTAVNTPEDASQRRVVDGVGVFTTIKEPAPLKQFVIAETPLLAVGETQQLTIQAYDRNYNPLTVDMSQVQVALSQGLERQPAEGDKLAIKAVAKGEQQLKLSQDGVTQAYTVQILDASDIAELQPVKRVRVVKPGDQWDEVLTLKTKTGKTKRLPASSVDWQFSGIKGSVDEQGKVTIDAGNPPGDGYLIGSYQGFSTSVWVKIGEEQKGTSPTVIKMKVGNKAYIINGQKAAMDQGPVMVDGRTLVPIRFIAEAMGGLVDWTAAEQKVRVRQQGHMVDMWLNQKDRLIVDGKVASIDVPPQIMRGRTLVPLRFLAETFGISVDWDEKTQTITLSRNAG